MTHDDQVTALQASDLMDEDWYLDRYPDVAQGTLSPVEHYLRYGARMGRDPGPGFDSRSYLMAYPDVAATGMNPLVHYIVSGAAEGRQPRPHPLMVGMLAVQRARGRLLTLGFTDIGLAELSAIADDHPLPQVRAAALRESALWHMRAAAWATALPLLERAHDLTPEPGFRATLVTAQLLCRAADGDRAGGRVLFDRAATAGLVTADGLLARATLEETPDDRLPWINRALERTGIPPLVLRGDGPTPYDRLDVAQAPPPAAAGGPRVTVLIAAHNAATTLPTALRSLTAQTWPELEILVLDDASTDDTIAVAHAHAAHDPRIRVVPLSVNGGAYAARNAGLAMATGEFVTLHDADDWSHPLKIETQVAHLLSHPGQIACTSQQARMRDDLRFTRWTGRCSFVIHNTSSLMLRRAPVMRALGGWDEVRFAADSEMLRRLRLTFGATSVTDMATGPLSLQRDGDTSVVADAVRGMNGFYYGVRKEYFDAQTWHHRQARGDGALCYAPGTRPFPVPPMMRPDRPDPDAPMRADTVIAGDFRGPGPALDRAVSIIDEARATGRITLLVEAWDPDIEGPPRIHDALRARIDGTTCRVLVWGERAICTRFVHLSGRLDGRYVPAVEVVEHAD